MNNLFDYVATIATKRYRLYLKEEEERKRRIFRVDALCYCRNILAGKIDN